MNERKLYFKKLIPIEFDRNPSYYYPVKNVKTVKTEDIKNNLEKIKIKDFLFSYSKNFDLYKYTKDSEIIANNKENKIDFEIKLKNKKIFVEITDVNGIKENLTEKEISAEWLFIKYKHDAQKLVSQNRNLKYTASLILKAIAKKSNIYKNKYNGGDKILLISYIDYGSLRVRDVINYKNDIRNIYDNMELIFWEFEEGVDFDVNKLNNRCFKKIVINFKFFWKIIDFSNGFYGDDKMVDFYIEFH